MKPLLYSELTASQLRAMREEGVDLLLIPVGATEPRGPHLPLNSATICVETVAHAVSARTGVPVLPVLPFGAASGAVSYPGALSLTPSTLAMVAREILASAIGHGFTRLLLLNMHAANVAPLQCALAELRAAHPQLQVVQKMLWEVSPRGRAAYESDGANCYGNAAETALMLYLAPHLVQRRMLCDAPAATDSVFEYSVAQISRDGYIGCPAQATPQMGAELFEALVTDWSYLVKRALVEKPPLARSSARPRPEVVSVEAAPIVKIEMAPADLTSAPLFQAPSNGRVAADV